MQLPDHAKFCSRCGFKQPVFEPETPVEPLPPVNPAPADEKVNADPAPAPDTSNPDNPITFKDENDEVIAVLSYNQIQEGVAEAFELSSKYIKAEMDGREDDMGDIYDEMVENFDKYGKIYTFIPEKNYIEAFAFETNYLARYRLEYCFDDDEAEQFADASVDLFKRYKDLYGDTFDEKEKTRVDFLYAKSAQYAAYVAYLNNYLDYAMQILMDQPANAVNLALLGSCTCLKGNAEKDINLVKGTLKSFEAMDSLITEKPKENMVQDIYRIAYTWYALMLAKNPDTYPDWGFTRDVPKAIKMIHKGIGLMTDEQYINMMKPDLDEYIEML